MRISADFKIEIKDHQNIMDSAASFVDKEDPFVPRMSPNNKKEDSDSDAVQEEDDDDEDKSLLLEDEFTGSFIEKLSPELSNTLLNVKKLRTKLAK
jgi:hypothetical protein